MAGTRVVLDTNVALSALVFPAGRLSWLRTAWRAGEIVPLVGRATAEELIRALAYPKFRLTNAEQEELLADYLPWCETVRVRQPPAVPECRDPSDRPFLELALAGGADALVTGDDDLLALASRFAVPILDPAGLRSRAFPVDHSGANSAT